MSQTDKPSALVTLTQNNEGFRALLEYLDRRVKDADESFSANARQAVFHPDVAPVAQVSYGQLKALMALRDDLASLIKPVIRGE